MKNLEVQMRSLRIAIIVIVLCVFATSVAYAEAGDFKIALRGQYFNGSIDQFVALPEYMITNNIGVAGAGVFDGGGVTTNTGMVFKINGFAVNAIAGINWNPTTGDLAYVTPELHVFYRHPWFEVAGQMFNKVAIGKDAETGDDLCNSIFIRSWAQAFPKDWHFKVGAQVESLLPQDQNNDWLPKTTKVGPKASFFAANLRLDIFYGMVVQDATPEIDSDTAPTTRVWFWLFF